MVREAEADAICDGENVYIIGIMEHIEPWSALWR
jgi:carbamoyl-phosphate synthase large subunit